jgi:hypothetical protein
MGEFASKIEKSRPMLKPRIVLHGNGGVGKTTFAAVKDSLTLPTEDGAGVLRVATLPQPNEWDDLIAMVREAINDLKLPVGEREFMDSFTHFVIDSIDVAEPLVWQKVCDDGGKPNIEAFGYGKGYTLADAHWIKLFKGLDMIRRAGVTVIVIAHSAMTTVDDPVVGSYSRFAPKLHKRANALLVEWADIVAWLDIERRPVDRGEGPRKTHTTRSVGKRLLHLDEDGGGFQAKNRYGLPSVLEIPKEDGFAVLEDAIAVAVGADQSGPAKRAPKKKKKGVKTDG